MRQKHKRRGIVLLLVVTLIPLVGMVSVLLASNSRMLFANTRRQSVQIDARLACESGLSWITSHPAEAGSITKDNPQVLTLDHKNKVITCTIKPSEQTGLIVTGRANDRRFSSEYKTEYSLGN